MEAHEMIEFIEDSTNPVPDHSRVRVLASDGTTLDVVGVEYEKETNTFWIKAEYADGEL